jgi:hypothetical protein
MIKKLSSWPASNGAIKISPLCGGKNKKRAHNSNQLAAVWWNYKLRAGNRIVLSLSPTRLHPSIRQSAKSDESTHSLFPVKMFPSFWQASAFYAVPRWKKTPSSGRDEMTNCRPFRETRARTAQRRKKGKEKNLRQPLPPQSAVRERKRGKSAVRCILRFLCQELHNWEIHFDSAPAQKERTGIYDLFRVQEASRKSVSGGLFAARLFTGKSSRSSLSGFDIYESIWDDCRENLSAYINACDGIQLQFNTSMRNTSQF